MTYQLHHGDCINIMPLIERESIDAVICDPPYGLGFMGKDWDHGVPGMHFWLEALRCAKPGAYLLAFGGTRTFHRLAVAIEDAGWEIRDTIMYVYGSGFPKGHDAPWEIHKKACTSCGFMVEYNHEEIESYPTANEGASIGATREKSQAKYHMRFVRATYLQTPVYACAQCGQVLQPFMSEQESSTLRAAWEKAESIWPEESSMERRRNSETPKGELQGCEVCTLSSGIFADGAQGWLHHGTSVGDGAIPWQVPNADGSRPSYRPQSLEQLHKQSDAFSLERTAQTYRGYNTALKPAFEPIIVARKPITGTVAENVQRYGTGAMNIDACRIETDWDNESSVRNGHADKTCNSGGITGWGSNKMHADPHPQGRWPANLIHDGSAEVLAGFPMTTQPTFRYGDKASRITRGYNTLGTYSKRDNGFNDTESGYTDTGSAARFFYCAPHDKLDLLFCRAKAIIGAWTKYDVPIAENDLPLSSQRAASVLSDVVTLVSRGEILLNDLTGLSTSVTPIELRRILEALITAILSLESAPLPDLLQGAVILNGCLVKFAEIQKPTGITTITISQWKSDGSADVATFSTMPALKDHGEKDSANRFVYCAKASKQDRDEGLEGFEAIKANWGDKSTFQQTKPEDQQPKCNHHPTVKPTALMRYLCRLVTPPQGVILDPFMGSGSTGKAAMLEGFNFIGIDTEIEYVEIAARRIERACEKVGIVIDQPMMFETRRETADRPKQLMLL